MANEKNLIPFNERTKSQQREIASKGGKASVEAKRKRKTLKEELGYDISMIVNPDTHDQCNINKTGIGLDVDNLSNLEYKEEPLLIYLYCD